MASFELAFVPWMAEMEARSVDWDFTDREGRFEVELRPASYAVQDADQASLTALVVPTGSKEVFLDIDLGP